MIGNHKFHKRRSDFFSTPTGGLCRHSNIAKGILYHFLASKEPIWMI
jgi:hypothetical protein